MDYTYNAYQRIIQENHRSTDGTALNKQIYYAYNNQTETRRTVTDKENTEAFVYDAKWNLLSHSDATGTTLYTYDAAGRVVKVSSPGYPVTTTYNAYGLCSSVSNAASGNTTYTYNGFDELATKKDANNNATTYTYDLAGKRYYFDDFERNINTASGTITDLDYIFANGRLVALVRKVGSSKTCYGVMTDRLGSLMSLYTSGGLTQKFSYDAWGNRRDPLTGVALSSAELTFRQKHSATSIFIKKEYKEEFYSQLSLFCR